MNSLNTIDDKFFACCFTLSEEDILKFDEKDNGPINNVMVGLAPFCYGVRLFDDQFGLTVEMFYIDGQDGLKGDIIRLEVNDEEYSQLLLRFCIILADGYKSVNALIAYNTFQQKLRGFLEKRKLVTVSNLELRKYKGKDTVLFSSNKRGIIMLHFIDQKEFYQDFFNKISDEPVGEGKNYVYLMVNTDTGLIKIGKSKNPVYRERTLHSQEPSVHRIAMWCCGKEIEKELHKLYDHKRVRGEWFKLSIADLASLEKYMNNLLQSRHSALLS